MPAHRKMLCPLRGQAAATAAELALLALLVAQPEVAWSEGTRAPEETLSTSQVDSAESTSERFDADQQAEIREAFVEVRDAVNSAPTAGLDKAEARTIAAKVDRLVRAIKATKPEPGTPLEVLIGHFRYGQLFLKYGNADEGLRHLSYLVGPPVADLLGVTS